MTRKRTILYTLAMGANADLFNNAIQLQQSKKYEDALNAYHNLLAKGQLTSEQGSVVSQNMALIYKQLNQIPLSYVYNQKSLFLDPSNSSAEKFLKTELLQYKPAEIARSSTSSEQLQSLGLKLIPLEILFIGFVVLFSLCLKTIFDFFVQKKKALVENIMPQKMTLKIYFYLAGLFLFAVLFWFQNQTLTEKKGLLKVASAQVYAAPGENQASLIEISSGQIMQILQFKEINGLRYVQVKVPGAFSGWIKSDQLEPLNLTEN